MVAARSSTAPSRPEIRTRVPYPVAVVGTGSVGMRHLRALAALPAAEPIAVPRRHARGRELAEAGTGTRVAADLAEAVASGARACVVATDTGRHVEDGLAAMAQGCDVLIEKPMARDAAEAARLLDMASRLGRRLFVGCVMRFSESLGIVRQWLPEIGAVHSVRVECQSYLPEWRPQRPYRESYSARADEGGALRDLVHELDYAGWLFGWPSMVGARVRTLGRLGIEADEAADLWWEVEGGGVVSVRLDYLTRPARRVVRACGAAGTLEWDAIAGRVSLWRANEPVREMASSQTRDETFAAQAAAFLAACDGHGADPRLATGEEGMRVMAICDAARRASASHRDEPVSAP